MPFVPKPWQSLPAKTTKLNGPALVDLEERLAGYADDVAAPLDTRLETVESSVAGKADDATLPLNVRRPFGIFAGANPSPGVDNHATIVAAIATGRPVYVPQGTYEHNGELNLATTGTRVFGDGPLLTVLKPTHAGAAISLGDDTGVAVVTNVDVSMLGIVGNASTTRGVLLNDNCDRWNLRYLRITGVVGTPGEAIGMTETTGTPAHFSGLIERCELSGNNWGIKGQGRHQHLTIRECKIFNNFTWGIDFEKDSASLSGGKINLVGNQVEKNGNTADTTGSIRLAGIRVCHIDGWYNEQDDTWPGCSLWVGPDETGNGCKQVRIENAYSIGNTAATKSIILKSVDSFIRESSWFSSFTTGRNGDGISFEPVSTGAVTGVIEKGDNVDNLARQTFVGPFDPCLPTASSVVATGKTYASFFTVERVTPVTQAHISVQTPAGNVNVLLFEESGTFIASTGSTLLVGSGGVRQTINLAGGTVWLRPGVNYVVGIEFDNATAACHYISITNGLAGFLERVTSVAGTTFPTTGNLTIPRTADQRGYMVALT